MRRRWSHIDFGAIMHPDDKKTVAWLNGLKVPYKSKWEFVRQLTLHPTDHDLKTWYEIFKAGVEYYTFQDFLRATTNRYQEAYSEVEYQGEGINITASSLPQMYRQLEEACAILGISEIPAYSTDWEYGPYHFSNGDKHRRIVMMSGSPDLLTDDEMMFVLGHELGHFACGHKPYHMLIMTFYMPFMNDAAFRSWASIIKLPLFEWYRKSDYSADRVGLLCCQDINVALTTMIKKAGLPRKCYDQINISAFIQQAHDFEEHFTGTMNTIIKNLYLRSSEFPWLVDRAAKLLEWYHSASYQQFINSNRSCLQTNIHKQLY